MSDVVKASKQANVHHYIHTLKGGYESMINESGSIFLKAKSSF